MDNKNKTHFSVQNFKAASIPQYQEIIKDKKWVWYGNDNLFPQHLIALYNASSIHRSALNAVMYGIKGRSIKTSDGKNPMVNRTQTLQEVWNKVVMDKVIFGGFALNMILNNEGGLGEFYHMDFSRVRSGKPDQMDQINHYYYSTDWSPFYIQKNKPVELPSFNLSNTEDSVQVYYQRQYSPSMSYYPPPSYLAAITSIQTDVEIKNYHLNNLQLNLNGSMAISFPNGVPPEEERQNIENQLIDKYTGTDNAGSFFLFFSENKESEPTITPIPNNASDSWYANVAPQVEQTILTAHRITSPMLLGIKTEGQLGGRNEVLDAYNLFFETVLKPIQEELIQEMEKIMFLQTGQEVQLVIEQNKILPDIVESAIDKAEGFNQVI